MEIKTFVETLSARLREHFSNVRVYWMEEDTESEPVGWDFNGKITEIEYTMTKLEHPKLLVYMDDTTKAKDEYGLYPLVGMEIANIDDIVSGTDALLHCRNLVLATFTSYFATERE